MLGELTIKILHSNKKTKDEGDGDEKANEIEGEETIEGAKSVK